MNIFLELLEKGFKGDIAKDEKTLDEFSHDASLFEIKPSLVVFPKDVSDVKLLVKAANEAKKRGENISLTARAAGTDMTGGPLTESVVVSFTKYFNHVKEVGEDLAVTEPGVYYRDFEKKTLRHDLLMPSYPASKELCAIGGMIANNAGGEKSLSYGKTEKFIQSINVVLSDGNEYIFKALSISELEEKKKEDSFEGEVYRKMYELIENNYDIIKKAKPDVSKNSAGYLLWNVFDRQKGVFDLSKKEIYCNIIYIIKCLLLGLLKIISKK